MKGKKPLILMVLVLAMLLVALILPAAAMGEDENGPVNWVEGNYNSNNTEFPDTLMGFTINVQQGTDLSDIDGFVLQKIMRSSPDDPEVNPFALAPVVRRATEFWPEGFLEGDDYWWNIWQFVFGLGPDYVVNYARFYDVGANYSDYDWPDLEKPSDYTEFVDANIADFVIYLDAEFLADFWEVPPEIHWTTYPHRYVVVDFDDPEKEDLVQIYGLELPTGGWIPQLGSDDDLVTVPAGYLEVHVEWPYNDED